MAKLFFVAYGGGHAAMLSLVAQRALRDGQEVIFLGLTTAKLVLEQMGLPSIGFADLWAFGAPGAQAYGDELAAQLPASGPVSLSESKAYLGLSFADLAEDLGEAEARQRYLVKNRHAFLPVGFMQRVLSHYRPDVVVATNSPRAEQAAILAAGRLGIPSLCLVDLFGLQEVRWIGQKGFANKVCVLNDTVREMFLREGRGDLEVVTTGNPVFDHLNDPLVIAAGSEMRKSRGWTSDMKIILWASQVEPQAHPFNDKVGDPTLPSRIEQKLRNFVREHAGYRLIVRFHPSENRVFLRQERVEFSPSSEQLSTLLHAVDLVVVTASTVGLEAYIAGRPVITVDCSVFTEDAPYSKMGLSTGVAKVEDLPNEILRVAASFSNTNSKIKKCDFNDSTNRILTEIKSLVINRNPC